MELYKRYGRELIQMTEMHKGWIPEYKEATLADLKAALAEHGMVAVPSKALAEVMRISDRKHDAWDQIKAAQEQG